MINLIINKDKSVRFEINKANIINQGLSLNPKVILLGGTELDVAKLYKGAKDTLLKKEDELEAQLQIARLLDIEITSAKYSNEVLSKKIKKNKKDLYATQKKVSKLNLDKDKLKKDVENIFKEVEKQKNILKIEKISTQKIRDDYKKANTELDKMSSILFSQEKKVEEKEIKLSTLTQKIEKKAIEFQKLQDNLATQDVQIQDQGRTIASQTEFLYALGLVAIVFFMLVLIIFKTLRKVHQTNDALVKTQNSLELQVEETKQANTSKTKFLAHMSHELRTPLNAVLGYSQLLQKDSTLSDENHTILATINRSGEHLLELINDVLEVSKIEAGKIELDPISFDLYIFLDDIYGMFAERMSSKGLTLELIKDKGLPKYINADINKIRQIFINIIGNSIKFTTHGGITIRVGYKLNDSVLLIQIEDTGEGINQDEIEELFVAFSQTISGKLGGGGAGLGLSIVQEYLDLMGGSVDVKSKRAFGTTFYLNIPYEIAESTSLIKNEIKEVKSLKKENMGIEVLIADDSETNNDLMEKTLTRVGFKVTAVENGFEALRNFKLSKQSLILLDIQMPVMDGYKALHEIRSLEYGKEASILAVTASVFGLETQKVEGAGFDAIIRKPFKIMNFLRRLRRP